MVVTRMIISFHDEETRTLYETGRSRRFGNVARQALRRLRDLDFAVDLSDLRKSPGNRLEPLKAGRAGQHSIRINDQYRVCFCWSEDGAHDVEIVDYH